MGVVQRQSLKNSLVNYFGLILGGLSTLFIYPLDWELYGKIQFSVSTAVLLTSFLSLGSGSLVNKYFPYFKNQKIKGFLSLVFIYSLINIALVSLLIFCLKTPIINFLQTWNFDTQTIKGNLFIIYPLAIFSVFIYILRTQTINYNRIVIPDLLNNIGQKIVVATIVFLGFLSWISFSTAGWILVGYYAINLIGMLIYLQFLNGLDFKWSILSRVRKSKHLEMARYMLYGSMNQIGGVLAYKIDLVMIGLLVSEVKVGYYSIFLFLSVVIDIPAKAVYQIVRPHISEAIENNKLTDLKLIYKKSSANLFVIGVAIFIPIWLNMQLIFTLMTNGNDLIIYKSIFLFIALSKLIDMLTGVNYYIIAYSKYFRANTLFLLVLALSNIGLNYWLINKMGIVGAAIATALSIAFFVILKTGLVYLKFKIHPFNKKLNVILLYLGVTILLPLLFPEWFTSIVLSILISIILSSLFLIYVYKSKVADEVNHLIDNYILKFFKK